MERFYKLLKKWQKYTGTDNVYLFENGLWLTMGRMLSIGALFLLALAFANLLEPSVYGNYRYVLSLIAFLEIFSMSGLGTAVSQATARNFEGSFYTSFKVKLKWGVLASCGAIAGAVYYWLQGNPALTLPLLLSAVFLPLMNAPKVYNDFLEGKKLFGAQVKYSTINMIIPVAALIAALFITKNLFWLIAVFLASHTFSNYFFYLLTEIRFQPNKKEDPQTISYGKHLSIMGAIGLIASQLDRILLFALMGPVALAVYYFAMAIPDQIRSFSKSIFTLVLPKFSAQSPEEIKRNMTKRSLQLLFLASMMVFIYVISAPYVYKIFFPQYIDSIFYSQIYIFSLLTLPVGLMSLSFQAKAKKRELYSLQITPFVQIVLLASLIPPFGIMGAFAAILASKVLGVILTLILFRKF